MKHPDGPQGPQDQYVSKRGLTHTGAQRSRCQSCRRYCTPDPKPEGSDVAVRPQALKLYLEGTRFRALGRPLGLHQQPVSNGITQAATALPAQVTASPPTETRELDELSTDVPQKKTAAAS